MTRKTFIEHYGQSFVDEPVYEYIDPKRLSLAVGAALKSGPLPPLRTLVGYERIQLRWMKPGKDGKLVPKKTEGNRRG